MKSADSSEFVIGVVGGMGTYATIDYFKRIADAFPADKEWERPRILIDNRCTMPSRVRAILYGERREELVELLAQSACSLIAAGATHVFYACNTSHVFLEEIYAFAPEVRGHIVDMIDLLANAMRGERVASALLLATEGTIQTGIYQSKFEGTGIDVVVPDNELQKEIRFFIEVVKKGDFSSAEVRDFAKWFDSLREDDIILGCTELPVIWRRARADSMLSRDGRAVHDPIQCVIQEMVRLFEEKRACGHDYEAKQRAGKRFEEREV